MNDSQASTFMNASQSFSFYPAGIFSCFALSLVATPTRHIIDIIIDQITIKRTMGYFQRFVIGVIISISAYHFLQDSYQRYSFHYTAGELLSCLKIDNCYQCLDNIRIGIAAFIFTGGLALIFDSCVVTGVIVELGLLALEAVKLRYCGCLGIYQTIFVHLLLLTILLSELKCGSCCKTVQSEEKKAESVPRKRSEQIKKEVVEKKKAPALRQPEPVTQSKRRR